MIDGEMALAQRSEYAFAHASEAEFGRILDFYQVAWEYEPQVFPILWDLDGNVLESFAPDFYLPELELFVELTTLQQRLVRKKNRKVRRLRELYPSLRIKLFYARDFRALMVKYGRSALLADLSGTLGQVAPRQLEGEDEARADETGRERFAASGFASESTPAPQSDAIGSRSTRRRRRRSRERASEAPSASPKSRTGFRGLRGHDS
jgi:hypothetical protein